MPRGSDFFSASQSLDAQQIKAYLQSPDPFLQTVAIKHVIAQMTLGKDMSPHFSDVAQLVKSTNFEIKRLVYLYLMQNAKSQPDKTVLLAGTFVRDASHESPLIRGTAVRTMTAMQIHGMISFSQTVVLKCLKDSDPYVRRNAAVGAIKIHHVAPTVIHESGILHLLVELLSDAVASVVATAACVLAEITFKDKIETVDTALAAMTTTMLAALNECSEWSQLYLLRAISRSFKVQQAQPGGGTPQQRAADAEVVAQRVLPFLQSNNSSVAFGAVRVILSFLSVFCPLGQSAAGGLNSTTLLTPMQQAELERRYVAKIAQPLVSMLSGVRPEMRYVALRNLRVIVQRYKDPFAPFIANFYLKFDDAIYVKLEKLDLLLNLATRSNAEAVLAEFAEYTKEVDVELVRKAVRCVGVLAVKQPDAAKQCVERLVQLIDSRVPYIVQEAAVVVQNILRQYPTEYEGIIVTLCKAIAVLDEAESKAAVVWVVGEYADRIVNAVEIISQFLDSFPDESLEVQLATLSATVKLFLTQRSGEQRDPAKQAALERVLALGSASPIPDLRDRSFFYWRLILKSPSVAAQVVRAEKDRIVDVGTFDRLVLNELLQDVGSLSCVIHRPAASVLAGDERRLVVAYDDADEYIDEEARNRDRIASETGVVGPVPTRQLDSDANPASDADTVAMDFSQLPTAQVRQRVTLTKVLDANAAGKGLDVSMAWLPGAPLPSLKVSFALKSTAITSTKLTTMQLNANRYGLGLGQEFPCLELKSAATGGDVVTLQLALNCNNAKRASSEVQVAIRTDQLGVFFFVAPPIDTSLMFGPAPPSMDAAVYAQDFAQLPIAWVLPTPATPAAAPRVKDVSTLTKSALKNHGLLLVHSKMVDSLVGMHLFTVSVNGARLFAEVTIEAGTIVLANVKTSDPLLAEVFGEFLLTTLTSM